ncbi:hypothetical protein QR680_015854 [Steinernema hermaphroditum]|uniref:Major facilitator superfamily (MFS) profile domain-containing protein n=1 Tax=Steinernema hermaphroditum TaxID=289476 RepID=A0AA39HB20_9BILA|nr:hypothetical protein QR680_015854 [Steinernema hermaphroditum]
MFGSLCALAIRSNLGTTIVCMVNSTLSQGSDGASGNSSYDNSCPSPSSSHMEDFGYDGILPWDSKTQGLMFSASSIGSFLLLLPAGFCADRYSPRMITFSALIISAVITYFSPWIANSSAYGFVVSRFLLGCAYGFIIPSFTAIASRWFVPNERSTLNAIHTSGVQLSGVFLGLVTPPLCSLKELGGWASVYYLCSTLTITWAVLWLCFSSNFPDQHRSISDDEINYISENMIVKKGQKKGIFPWRAAFMSTPFLAVLLARTTLVTQHQIMTFYTTSFIRDVLKSDLKSNGLFTTLPYIASFIAKIGVSGFADHLKQRKVLSYNTSTRLFQTTGNFGIALCFAILAVVADCNHVFLSVSLLVLQAAFTTFVSPGMHTSALSIAPLHAGGLHSVSMFIANLVSSAAPTFVGSILVHNTPNEWSIVFFSLAGINLLTGIFFAIFGSAEVQEWSKPTQNQLDQVAPNRVSP